MDYPRARLYQSTLHLYYARDRETSRSAVPRRAAVSRNGSSALAGAPAFSASEQNRTFRHFVAGAGTPSLPIDVDDWISRPPIDVDASGSDDELPTLTSRESASPGGVRADSIVAPPATRNVSRPAPQDKRLFVCPICYDTLNKPVVRNFGYSMICPLCRAEVVDAPVRDSMLELELAKAIAGGLVESPSTQPRRRPYTWVALFPPL
ncbi:hypothetical protein C8R47DRAFT_1069597 [Mycena vitilis]|nr:hypothetical protein C8R47DRAFT_1069597 [Mycena vitilis]